jgi:hypothetical protein
LPAIRGWLVTDVESDGPLAGRIHSGEVIDRIQQDPIEDADDVRRALDRGVNEDLQIHIVPVSGERTPRTLTVHSASAPSPER